MDATTGNSGDGCRTGLVSLVGTTPAPRTPYRSGPAAAVPSRGRRLARPLPRPRARRPVGERGPSAENPGTRVPGAHRPGRRHASDGDGARPRARRRPTARPHRASRPDRTRRRDPSTGPATRPSGRGTTHEGRNRMSTTPDQALSVPGPAPSTCAPSRASTRTSSRTLGGASAAWPQRWAPRSSPGDPVRAQWLVDGPLSSRDAASSGTPSRRARARRARGVLHRVAPPAGDAPVDAHRDEHAQRAVREAAGPCRCRSTTAGSRAAAVPLGVRPVAHPPVAGVRGRAAVVNIVHDRGRLRRAVHLRVAARPDLPGAVDSRCGSTACCSSGSTRGRAAQPGPGRRPRDQRRASVARIACSGVRSRSEQARGVQRAGRGAARDRDREAKAIASICAVAAAGCRTSRSRFACSPASGWRRRASSPSDSCSRSSRRRPCCGSRSSRSASSCRDVRHPDAVGRFFEVMDSENTIEDPAEPRTIASRTGRCRSTPCTSGTRTPRTRTPTWSTGSSCSCSRRDHGARRPDRQRQDDPAVARAAALRRHGGSITIDGVDVRDLSRRAPSARRCRVRGRHALLDERAGQRAARRPDLSGDEAERIMREALDIAQASFVDDLPEGVDTASARRACRSSGGQRQRLALARAIAARPSVPCSTTRCRRSTSTPRPASRRGSDGSSRTRRRSSSPTAPPP